MVVAVLSAASSLGFPFQNILTQTVSISPRNPKFFLQGMTKILGICTSLEGAVGYPKRCSNMRGYPKCYGFQNKEFPKRCDNGRPRFFPWARTVFLSRFETSRITFLHRIFFFDDQKNDQEKRSAF